MCTNITGALKRSVTTPMTIVRGTLAQIRVAHLYSSSTAVYLTHDSLLKRVRLTHDSLSVRQNYR